MSNASSNNEQNGRQHTVPPGQAPIQRPLQDPRLASKNSLQVGAEVDICRDFIWGTCTKTGQCKYRHELDFDEMKKVLRFCRDYQNRPGCTREDCTYLHTTKEEQSLFMTTGRLPRVIAERHMNMMAAANAAETIPQIALFIKESYGNTPPPPPPPPTPSTPCPESSPRPSSRELMPPPPTPPRPPTGSSEDPAVPTATLPAMPSPTSTPVPKTTNSSVPKTSENAVTTTKSGVLSPVTPLVYTGPPPNMFPVDVPPPNLLSMPPPSVPPPSLFPLFDATRPPPPLPNACMQIKASAAKRRQSIEAGPSKRRKIEVVKPTADACSNCQHKKNRIATCKVQCKKLELEEEIHKIVTKAKTDEVDSIMYIIKSTMRPDAYHILDDFVDGVPHLQLQDILAEINQASFISSGMSTVMSGLLDWLVGDSRNSSPVARADDTLIQSLSSLTRRSGLGAGPTTNNVIELFKDVVMRNSNKIPDRLMKLSPTGPNNNGIQGFGQYNGQKAEDASRVTPNSFSGDQRAVPRLISTAVPPPTIERPSAPFGYPNYAAPVPPPNRPYYTQPFTTTNNYMVHNQNYRGVPPPYNARGPVPAVATNNKEHYPQNMNNRYPAPPQ